MLLQSDPHEMTKKKLIINMKSIGDLMGLNIEVGSARDVMRDL